jgi:nicotinate dehydrogenase subunit A
LPNGSTSDKLGVARTPREADEGFASRSCVVPDDADIRDSGERVNCDVKTVVHAIREDRMARFNIRVNGETRVVDADPDTPVLYVLRDILELKGPKFGCGLAQCGACTVLVDGEAARSCVLPIESLKGGAVTTLEGLGTSAKPSRLQQAFIDEQAAQCGYCINGMIMTSAALIAKNKSPSEAEIRAALADNLCRCGTHHRIVAAVKRATAAA